MSLLTVKSLPGQADESKSPRSPNKSSQASTEPDLTFGRRISHESVCSRHSVSSKFSRRRSLGDVHKDLTNGAKDLAQAAKGAGRRLSRNNIASANVQGVVFGGNSFSFDDFQIRHIQNDSAEQQVLEMEGQWPNGFFLQHYSNGNRITVLLSRWLALWTVLFVPFNSAFRCIYDLTFYVHVDQGVDAMYVLCQLVRLRTSHVDINASREVVDLQQAFWQRTRELRFVADWVSIGASLLCVMAHFSMVDPLMTTAMLIKLVRVWRWICPYPADVALFRQRLTIWQYLYRFLFLCLSVFIYGHYVACLWIAVLSVRKTCSELRTGVLEQPEEHLAALSSDDARALWSQGKTDLLYIASVRDCMSIILSAGLPPAWDLELITVLVLLAPLGAIVLGFILAQFIVLIQSVFALSQRNNEHQALVQAAMNSLQLPVSLQFRIVEYLNFLHLCHNKTAFQSLFDGLSMNLLTELKLYLFRRLIVHSPFLQACSPEIINQIVLGFQECVFSPGDLIMRKGEVGNEIYFIIKGACEILGDGNQLFCVKTSGDYFGEVAVLVPGVKRTAWVRAKTFSVLAQLTKDRMDLILTHAPQQRQQMLERIGQWNNVKKEIDESKAEKKESKAVEAEDPCSPRFAKKEKTAAPLSSPKPSKREPPRKPDKDSLCPDFYPMRSIFRAWMRERYMSRGVIENKQRNSQNNLLERPRISASKYSTSGAPSTNDDVVLKRLSTLEEAVQIAQSSFEESNRSVAQALKSLERKMDEFVKLPQQSPCALANIGGKLSSDMLSEASLTPDQNLRRSTPETPKRLQPHLKNGENFQSNLSDGESRLESYLSRGMSQGSLFSDLISLPENRCS